MSNSISLNLFGISSNSQYKSLRENKGKSLITLPSDYVVIDIETTGLDPRYNDIIEVAALKISNNQIIDTFSSLVKPYNFTELDDYITSLTGITTKMLNTAPEFSTIENEFLSFIDSNILIGHNVNFDINFLYDETGGKITNDFVDTMRISRRVLPELDHHRLSDISAHYNITVENSHRALDDCKTTFHCYNSLCINIIEKYGSIDDFCISIKKSSSGINTNEIKTEKTVFDETHPLFNKNCAFTGTLEKCTRKEAMQLVVDLGGIVQNGVTAKTNFLILGNNDYCSQIKDGKSSKQKKAEALKLQGKDIEIISENVFYDYVFNE